MDGVVAFVVRSGLGSIDENLRDLLARGGRVRFLTGDYLVRVIRVFGGIPTPAQSAVGLNLWE
jgi:hypothetical protein